MLGDFNENFSIIPVNNSELRQQYTHLLSASTSDYSPYSVDSLLEYKKTKAFVGAVRVILGNRIKGKALLPVEEANKNLFEDIIKAQKLQYGQVAEVSELYIMAHFRPKLAILGIIRAVLQSCFDENVGLVYILLDQRIQRLLMRIGVSLNSLDDSLNDDRQYFTCRPMQLVESLQCSQPSIWEVLTDEGKLCCPYKNLIYKND